MSLKYKELLSPIKINNVVLRNRLIATPSNPHFIQATEKFPTEALITHYANKAKAGAAIVTCKGNNPVKTTDVHSQSLDITNGAHQHMFAQVAEAVHYYGAKASQLYVKLGSGCTLNGAISATESRHINEKGEQNTHFTIEQYYYLGHLENRPFYNGDNDVEVTLENGAVWNVTGEGILTSLCVGEGCVFNGKATLNGEAFVPAAGETYKGDIRVCAK